MARAKQQEQKSENGWPADKVERWAIEKLIPHARNARTHSDAQVAQLAGSLREFGWTTPVLVDEDGTLLAGHGRVLAARRLNIAEVPVMVARGWSDAKKRAYMLADNKLALNAGWDEQLLSVELGDLQSIGVDLESLGFGEKELKDLLSPSAPDDDVGDGDSKLGDSFNYMVIIECDGEEHQGRIIEEFTARGLKCRPSIS